MRQRNRDSEGAPEIKRFRKSDDQDSKSDYQILTEQGYIVKPVLTEAEVTDYRRRLIEELGRDPYFIDSDVAFSKGMTMGGFGGLATPHSYHNRVTRELRLKVHKTGIDLCPPGMYVEQCPDRTLYRAVDQCPSGESWHRDESPKTTPGATIFGGWLNLNSHDEFFACCPGSHRIASADTCDKNFNTIPKEERPKWKALESKISIPPGHVIVFYENIVHRVYPGKKRREYRLFTGWRIGNDPHCVDPDLIQTMKNFQTPKIKGGMQPPVYSRQHLASWMDRIEEWSKNVSDSYCYNHTVKSGKNKGKTFRIARRFPKIPIGQYIPYSDVELQIFKPQLK